MANALSRNMSTPPVPNPDAGQTTPTGNAMASPGAPMTPQGAGMPMGQGPMAASPMMPPQAQTPAPTHQQTVVALRHFSAIERELNTLLADPDLGKADMKSKIIDGTTTLVGNGILSPSMAVTMLATVPDKPYDQKVWMQQHLMTTQQAETAVLSHHQAGYLGQTVDNTPPDPDNHQQDVAGLTAMYGKAKG